HLSAAVVGGALTIGAAGTVTGALQTQRLTRQLGTARSLFVSTVGGELASLFLPLGLLGLPAVALAVSVAARGLIGPLWNVNAVTLRQRLIPAEVQARVTAASRTLVMGTLSVGSLAGGALGGVIGVTPTSMVGPGRGAASGIFVLPPLL